MSARTGATTVSKLRQRLSAFLGELKRRQVIQVAVVYAIVEAGVAQAAEPSWATLRPSGS